MKEILKEVLNQIKEYLIKGFFIAIGVMAGIELYVWVFRMLG